jgi:hypothetical protein
MMLGEDWREVFINFIRDQRLPAGMDARSTEAARVMRRSKGFVLVDSKVYRRGARSGVLMKCVTKEDGYDILREIHEAFTATKQLQEHWWGKHTGPAFGGPPQCPMRRILYADAKIVNSSASSLMFQPTASSLYHHPGPSLAGALI